MTLAALQTYTGSIRALQNIALTGGMISIPDISTNDVIGACHELLDALGAWVTVQPESTSADRGGAGTIRSMTEELRSLRLAIADVLDADIEAASGMTAADWDTLLHHLGRYARRNDGPFSYQADA